MAIDKLQGYMHTDPDLSSVNTVWLEQLQHLPERIRAIHSNVKLLRKCAEDAKRDAQLWASRSEGDEGREFDEPEEGQAVGTTWRPDEVDMRFSLHEVLANKQEGESIIQASQSLKSLVDKLQKAGFSELTTQPSEDQDQGHRIWSQTELNLPKPTLNMIKAAQLRLHKEKVLAIEGDDEDAGMQATGLGQGENNFGDDTYSSAATFDEPEAAQTWVDIAPDQSFFQVGQAVAEKMTLNRLQWTALGLACEAMDQLSGNGGDEEDEVPSTSTGTTKRHRPHFQYVGGSGGTGKSWAIKAIQTVLSVKRVQKEMVITATSGTAAAGIEGNTIHSAIGLTFKDRDGQQQDNMPMVSDERRKQRWRRRKLLIVDEVSMLGLDTLYEIDQKLRFLRGFQDLDFGGLPIVIFTGDFLQFGPIQQKGLLTDIERVTEEDVRNKVNDRKVQRHWRQLKAKKLWEKFDKVVILEEQKRAQGDPFLLGLLERIRNGQQTQEDMDKLNTCYDPQAAMDFSQGRRAITPLNKHRWDLTLHAVLEFGKEHGKKVSIFLSAHQWKTRIPSQEEIAATLQLGDAGALSVPSIFAYAEGMPVIVNQNKYLGLKVANGTEFVAKGIVPDPNVQEYVVDEGLSIFFGPPCGILLQSEALRGLRIPHLPPNTIMLGTEVIQLQKQKHGKHICPDLYQRAGFEMGVSRRGLPCVPGFVLTDYKSQSRTMEKVLLGLYGRRGGEEVDRSEIISLYVQISRCQGLDKTRLLQPVRAKDFLEPRMYPDLIAGNERLKKASDKTAQAFAARHGG
jgi:PIF1-like helicase